MILWTCEPCNVWFNSRAIKTHFYHICHFSISCVCYRPTVFSEKYIKSQPAKMVVKAAPRYELLAAFETNKRSFPSVAPCVLFQMAESLEPVILERQNAKRHHNQISPAFLEGCCTMLTTVLSLLKLSLAWVVHGVEP